MKSPSVFRERNSLWFPVSRRHGGLVASYRVVRSRRPCSRVGVPWVPGTCSGHFLQTPSLRCAPSGPAGTFEALVGS